MSIQAVAAVLDADVGEVAPKMLLICIANAHNTGTGVCRPTIDRLAKESGMGRSTVKRWLRWLVDKRFLQVVPSHAENGRQQSHQYRLTLEEGSNLDRTEGSNLDPVQIGLEPACEPEEGVTDDPPLKKPEEKPLPPLPPKPDNVIRQILRGTLDEAHVAAIVEDRERLGCPLTAAEADTVVRYCDGYADANAAAEVLIANRYRNCRIRRPLSGRSKRAGEGEPADTLPRGAIIQAAEPLAFEKAIELSGWQWKAGWKQVTFPPEVAERARLLAAPARLHVVPR